MKNELTIFFDDLNVQNKSRIPQSLGKHFIAAADYCIAAEDSCADLLYQEVETGAYSIININVHARQKVQIRIEQNEPKTLQVSNLGTGLKMAVGSLAFQYFDTGQFNIFHAPVFSLTMNIYPNKGDYELFMINIKEIRSLINLSNAEKDKFKYYSNRNQK